MLYGYYINEKYPATFTTMVVAADFYHEIENWFKQIIETEKFFYDDYYIPSFVDMMMDECYSSYKKLVYAFYHRSSDDQEKFVEKHNIVIKGKTYCQGRHDDMLDLQKELDGVDTGGIFSPVNKDKTIEEIFGLKEDDKWDRRSEQEKEYDKHMRAQMKKAQAKGDMSGDSFGGAVEIPEVDNETLNKNFKDDIVRVTEIRVDVDKDTGEVSIDNILARKSTGDIEKPLTISERRQAKVDELKAKGIDPSIFSPDDFATALRGDGALHATGGPVIKGNPDLLKGTVDGKISKKLRDARKIYKEEEERLEKEKEEKIAADILQQDIEDQKNGIFHGCDLLGTKIIKVEMVYEPDLETDELPPSVKEAIKKSIDELKDIDEEDKTLRVVPKSTRGIKIRATTSIKTKKEEKSKTPVILIKDYPFSSTLNGKYIIPKAKDILPLIHSENVKLEGTINLGDVRVLILSKEDEMKTGWIVYQYPDNNYNVVKLR